MVIINISKEALVKLICNTKPNLYGKLHESLVEFGRVYSHPDDFVWDFLKLNQLPEEQLRFIYRKIIESYEPIFN